MKNITFSGYQKTKIDETRILESLRDEGLLAKPKGKTAGNEFVLEKFKKTFLLYVYEFSNFSCRFLYPNNFFQFEL